MSYVPSQLVWAAAGAYPQVLIPLFCKEHSVPVRKPKTTEINTIPMMDPASQFDISNHVLFFGAPEPLQLTLSGWLITPTSTVTNPNTGFAYRTCNPTVDGTSSGTSLSLPNMSYADIISAYLEGRMNYIAATGRWIRQDPAYYIDPYGRRYNSPIISSWEPSYSTVTHKTPFSMTLTLEAGK